MSSLPPPPPAVPPPPPPSPSGRGLLTGCLIALVASIVLIIGAAVVILVVAGGEIERRFGDADPSSFDLTVEECGVVEGRLIPHVIAAITNTSDISRGFRLDIYVMDDRDRVGERDIYVDPLEPAQTARLVHPIPVGDADPDSIRCEIEVSYWGIDSP